MDEHRHERLLRDAFRALAAEEADAGASHAVPDALLDEVRSIRRTRRRALVNLSAAAAILVVSVSAAVFELARRPLQAPTDQPLSAEETTEFFPLQYSTVPAGHPQIVRIEVPSTALTTFGVDITGSSGDATVQADVVVGEDGLARAIRFVRPVTRGIPY